jgi:hypothetical protein
MSHYAITPGWALPTIAVVMIGIVASLFGTGCTAYVDSSGNDFAIEPAPPVCGGAVCFDATQTTVKHWGDGDVTLVTFRADDLGCEEPHLGTAPANDPSLPADDPSGTVKSATEGPFKSGRVIELRLRHPKPGARLPVVSQDAANDSEEGYVTARALRIGPDGRAMASEETVSGEATVLDLDPRSGRVKVRVEAKWSSGVSGELVLDIDGPHECKAG